MLPSGSTYPPPGQEFNAPPCLCLFILVPQQKKLVAVGVVALVITYL